MEIRNMIFALLFLGLASCHTSGDNNGTEAAPTPTTDLAIAGVPSIVSIAPATAPTIGGTFIKITGENFTPTIKAAVGSIVLKHVPEANYVHYVSPTEIYVQVPPFFTGKADIVLVNSNTAYTIRFGAITYYDLPAVTPDANPQLKLTDTFGLWAGENNSATLYRSQSESALNVYLQLGFSRTFFISPTPIAGSFDGQPGDTLGYYDHHKGEFNLWNSVGDSPVPDLKFKFGPGMTAIPVAGDFNGDGIDTIGVFVNTTGRFELRNENAEGPADIVVNFGTAAGVFAIPLVGDFDGDGIDTVGVFDARDGTIRVRNSNTDNAEEIVYSFGALNTSPVVGDFDGDGRDSVAVFDLATRAFYIRNSLSGGTPDQIVQVQGNTSTVRPVAGRWRAPVNLDLSPGYAWPLATPEEERISRSALDSAQAKIASFPNSRALLVVRNGRLVREAYFHATKPQIAYPIKSVSKSILSALYGIANRDGAIKSVNDTIDGYLPAGFIPELADARVRTITIGHLLTMSAGLTWNEGESAFMRKWAFAPVTSRFPVEQPVVADPGKTFNYSTGLTHLAARILSDAVGQDLAVFAEEKLFAKIGVKAKRWDHDYQGYKVGGAEMFMKARDMARFGQLYLDGGKSGAEQVVPAAWVAGTTIKVFDTYVPGRGYGGWWWTETVRGYNCYMALGYGGQVVFVVPALKLVVVTQSKADIPNASEGLNDGLLIDVIKNTIIPGVAL